VEVFGAWRQVSARIAARVAKNLLEMHCAVLSRQIPWTLTYVRSVAGEYSIFGVTHAVRDLTFNSPTAELEPRMELPHWSMRIAGVAHANWFTQYDISPHLLTLQNSDPVAFHPLYSVFPSFLLLPHGIGF
jgi:hypothetical protein